MDGADRARLAVQINFVATGAKNLAGDLVRGVAGEKGRELGHLVGPRFGRALGHLRLGLAGDRLDHPAERMRADAVRAHLVARRVAGDGARQAGDAELGGGVVDLSDAADQARGGGHVHEGAAFLRTHVRDGGAADVESAVEMHLHDGVEFFRRHAVEDAVAQDAGVVHDDVDLAVGIHGGSDDALGGAPVGHAIGVDDGLALAVEGLDFADNLLRRRCVTALAVDRGANVVDDDLGAILRHDERDRPADAAPRAGDNGNLAFKHLLAHEILSVLLVSIVTYDRQGRR